MHTDDLNDGVFRYPVPHTFTTAQQKSDAAEEQVKSLQTQVQGLTGDNRDLRLGVKLLPWWRATALSLGILALTMFGVTLLTLFERWRMRRRFVALAAMTDALSRLDNEGQGDVRQGRVAPAAALPRAGT